MRLHCPTLPHISLTRAHEWCAYGAKLRKLPAILQAVGHEAITYGDKTADVEVITPQDRDRWFGAPEWDAQTVFPHWDPDHVCWSEMNLKAAVAILERWRPGDALGLIAGRAQQSIAQIIQAVHPGVLVLEWGVGYDGIAEGSHCAFESTAWRHHVYGLRGIGQGRAFDTVIPNSFLLGEYTRRDSDGYLLFLGRHIEQKGLAVVAELAARYEVVTAGQGGPVPDVEWRGVVTGDEKAELLAGARAVIVPTLYLEPFGGVAVEAMISGVPVVTSDWGAFTETVKHGVDGFRCSTLRDYVDAVEAIDGLGRDRIAARAQARFSTTSVGPLYDRWLRCCATLHRDGWYEMGN